MSTTANTPEATMAETAELTTYYLTADELAATRDKIAKLNKRAGGNGSLAIDAKRTEVTETLPGGLEVTKVFYATHITGSAPKFAGWSFIAVLDFDAHAGLLTRTVPGFDGIIDRDSVREGWCDHCETARYRKTTFVVEHESGARKQVGSSCIKDFLGQNVSPVRFFDDTQSVFAELGGYAGGTRSVEFTVESALAASWAAVKTWGFVRKNDFNGVPTAARVNDILDPYGIWDAKHRAEAVAMAEKLAPVVAEAAGKARELRSWILAQPATSEYMINLQAIASAESVTAKHLGILASAPQSWARSLERDLRRAAERAEINNETLGEPGSKVTFTASVKSIRWISGAYGSTCLYTLVTDAGNLVKWFASNPVLGDDVTTEVFRLTATVKKHDEYNGQVSTVVTRAKIVK